MRHRGSHLGILWSLASPLLLLGLYVLVFGFIFAGKLSPDAAMETRVEYALVVFLGLAVHHFVAEVLSIAPTLIVGNPNFVNKVIFPLEVLPAAAVGTALVHFLLTLSLVVTGSIAFGVTISWSTLWFLPIVLLPLGVSMVGLALGISALAVYWRDVGQGIQIVVLALLFGSAVFYPVSQIPEPIWAYLRFNPLLHAIDGARGVLFWGKMPDPKTVFALYASGAVMLAGGACAFRRLRTGFSDVL